MYWIALSPTHDDDFTPWGWRALQFTPRVARVDEAILLEASASLKLWGGRKGLRARLLADTGVEPATAPDWAHGKTARTALGLLRLQRRGEAAPAKVPEGLPLDVLTEAVPHVPVLERIGCRTWGDLQALPRPGVARRFGDALLNAIDCVFGTKPEIYPWLQLPEDFDMNVELMSLATTAPELMWSAQRLLTHLQVWLQARNRGVVALELEWTLDLRRLNGVKLPPCEQMVVRTAQPTQDITHLRRLVSEHLSRANLSAPASYLRLRSLETMPFGGISKSLLPEDNVKGERLHQLIERLSVRLGEDNVVVPVPQADHRAEAMQQWKPARHATATPFDAAACDPIYPTWLLREPLRLPVRQHVPHFGGPLRRLTRLHRVETAWWTGDASALRDYFVAKSEAAGFVWIYRERPQQLSDSETSGKDYRWFLQGLYA
ncbi:DNA polymerase Y family protein [Caenimonas koreensis]|uniref:DNA polymerase Y family protein n=1 Tax=Caenimonas koreensis TaxID=367474 RepID=UPI00378407D0